MSAVLKPRPLSLRPMKEADLDRIVRIERAAYPYPWTAGNFRDCLHAGYSCWVAELDRDLVVGYSVLIIAMDEGHVLNCCVSPQFQGQGYGRQIMDRLVDTARSHGVTSLYLEVRPSNTRALRMYGRFGFEGIALRRGYYPADQGREDALLMRLML
jgi:[ribosomal protein S18]-alanine N-acetyltransferase